MFSKRVVGGLVAAPVTSERLLSSVGVGISANVHCAAMQPPVHHGQATRRAGNHLHAPNLVFHETLKNMAKI